MSAPLLDMQIGQSENAAIMPKGYILLGIMLGSWAVFLIVIWLVSILLSM